MRRIHASVTVVLGLALAVLPAAGNAADLPTVATTGDCGAGAGSTTETVLYNGQLVTVTTDNFGTCLASSSRAITAQSPQQAAAPGAAPAVPVPGRPAFTG